MLNDTEVNEPVLNAPSSLSPSLVPVDEVDDCNHHRDEDVQVPQQQPERRRLLFAGFLAGTTVLGTMALTAPFVVSRSPLPYMATPGQKVRRALDFVNNNKQYLSSCHNNTVRNRNKANTFLDLGSGDGQGVYEAVRSGYYQSAVGVELNHTLYILAQFRRMLFWTRQERRQSRFLWGDMFQLFSTSSSNSPLPLSQSNTIMVFGVTPLMTRISEMLAKACKPGTHILAYRFRLPLANDDDDNVSSKGEIGTSPSAVATTDSTLSKSTRTGTVTTTKKQKTHNQRLLHAKIIYDEEEMRVYQVTEGRCS